MRKESEIIMSKIIELKSLQLGVRIQYASAHCSMGDNSITSGHPPLGVGAFGVRNWASSCESKKFSNGKKYEHSCAMGHMSHRHRVRASIVGWPLLLHVWSKQQLLLLRLHVQAQLLSQKSLMVVLIGCPRLRVRTLLHLALSHMTLFLSLDSRIFGFFASIGYV